MRNPDSEAQFSAAGKFWELRAEHGAALAQRDLKEAKALLEELSNVSAASNQQA